LAAVENTKRPLADERIWRRRCMLTTEGGSFKVLMQIGMEGRLCQRLFGGVPLKA